ncbi:MAG: hypothetical protein J6330_10590 [Clostridia bacterium]|nr:hypothetical protein [Clostridia bacterium]
MNDSEKIQFDDEFISKRLKDKNRSSAVLYVFAAILILLAVGVVFVVVYDAQAFADKKVFFYISYLILLIICGGVFCAYLIIQDRKNKKRYKVSKGGFTVTHDVILRQQVIETYGARLKRSVKYVLTLENHGKFVTYTYELVGLYAQENEKCYVVAFNDSPDIPELVFNARIYEYTGQHII